MRDLDGIAQAKGLTDDEAQLARDLVRVLRGNLARNAERSSYYAGESGLKNIGIAIPEELTALRVACSWPAKAVDALADRSVYDGVSFRSGEDVAGVADILSANRIGVKYDKAKRTQLVHGCSFWTVSAGDGRCPAIIRQHSAESAAAVWDDDSERIKAGLVIAAFDRRPGRSNRPQAVNIYTADEVLVFRRSGYGDWALTRLPHSMGRPMMEAMVHSPTTDKPMGTSRITHAVMSITDSAIREALRSELHAEFFTSPQKFLLGASKKQMESMTAYEAFFGSLFMVGLNEEGNAPSFGQLPQSSMEPHVSYMRQLAAQFSGATDVPISTLGVIHDNPASSEAIHAAEQPLVIRAESMNAGNAHALEEVARMAAAIALGKPYDELTDEESCVVAEFRRPDRPSMASSADAALKMASTPGMEWFGGTDVCLELMGFTEAERIRMQSDKRRSEARRMTADMMQAAAGRAQQGLGVQAQVNGRNNLTGEPGAKDGDNQSLS